MGSSTSRSEIMAETTYHVPFPVPMTETKILGSIEEDLPPFDWETVDRILTLMSYIILERILRLTSTPSIDIDIKFQLVERLQILIEEYKNPR